VDVVVCRDQERGKIVGFGACALRQLFVNSVPQTVGYLFGLRTRQEYMRKFPLLHKGYAMIPKLHREQRVSFYLTTILEENLSAQRLLEKRRAAMPAYLPYGSYTVYTLFQRKKAGAPNIRPWTFRQARSDDSHRLVNFLSEHGRALQFFPVLQEQDLQSRTLPGLHLEHFYLLVDERDDILAAGALWDQAAYKQYVLQGYGGLFKMLAPVSRLFPLIGFPALPAPQSTLRFFTLSFWAVKHREPEIFRRFLRAISHVGRAYPFFLVGLHNRNPLGRIVERHPHIRYASRLYVVSWDAEPQISGMLDNQRIPYLECGLL